MNKELPEIIKDIFKEPDSRIWKGIWLDTLNSLLDDGRMILVWTEFIELVKNNHKYYKNMSLEQYIKWECKALVAKVIKLKDTRYDEKFFIKSIKDYLSKKEINLTLDMIKTIYDATNS